MNARQGLSLTLALTVLALMIGSGACGQAVATCDSICALPGVESEPACTRSDLCFADCPADCAQEQQACITAGHSADFQAYLTCVGNAGTFLAVQSVCAAESAALGRECGAATSGGSGTGAGFSSATTAGSTVDACVGPCTGSDGASGAPDAALGGRDASIVTPPTPCPDPTAVGRGAACDDGSASCPGAVDNGDCTGTQTCVCSTGHWTCPGISCPSPPPPVEPPCQLAGSCNAGSTCNLGPGEGPCGSGVELACSGGTYVVDAFTCPNGTPSCTFGQTGPDGCTETCSCNDNLMVCTGDCPDAGLASP